jgi:hypothetical protein
MRRFFVIPAGLVVLGLLAFNFLFVDLSISDCELIIDGIGGLLSSPVHELVVVEPMVEGVDHVMFLDKRKGVLFLEKQHMYAHRDSFIYR